MNAGHVPQLKIALVAIVIATAAVAFFYVVDVRVIDACASIGAGRGFDEYGYSCVMPNGAVVDVPTPPQR